MAHKKTPGNDLPGVSTLVEVAAFGRIFKWLKWLMNLCLILKNQCLDTDFDASGVPATSPPSSRLN